MSVSVLTEVARAVVKRFRTRQDAKYPSVVRPTVGLRDSHITEDTAHDVATN